MSVAAQFEIEYLQYMDADGQLVRDDLPADAANPQQLLALFKRMLFVRTFDSKSIALQRTGKLGTYAASLGHEATHVGIGASMRSGDVFAPSYREYGTMFERGVRPRDVLLYWGGDERGSDYPRDADAAIDFPICVPISTQCLHAAGAALSFKLQGKAQVAVACCGDGGSSKTDFYAALNSAGAYTLPLILCVINNGWAISVPRSAQTGAQTLAQKAWPAACTAYRWTVTTSSPCSKPCARRARALAGDGGTVIEFLTYRLTDHTTADDARRYRGEDEVKQAWTREPMLRLRRYLTAQGLWDEAQEEAWKAECGARIDEEVNAYLNTPVQPVEAMFDYLYGDPPAELLAQRAEVIALEARHG